MSTPYYPGLTDKCREALLDAAENSNGFLPQNTSGAVLGRLYRLGLAKRQEITEEGRDWIAANRLPEKEEK